MTYDVLRMPLQHKAFHCYIILSIWILLLVAGVYRFLETKQKIPDPTAATDHFQNLAFDVKTKRIFHICNLPNDIVAGEEGTLKPKQWSLKGLLILIRHGDRGPLQHVRNISLVNCGNVQTDLLSTYKEFLNNLTVAGRMSWLGQGPFHGFPILPSNPKQCQLAQLTLQGVAQLLELGRVLRYSYSKIWPKLYNLTQHEVLAHCTRYRRTFQSALALLYGLINSEIVTKLNFVESHSMSFCFQDCGCPISEVYHKAVQRYISQQLLSHPAVAVLSNITGNLIFSNAPLSGSDPYAVRDALLTYICHASNLPCLAVNNCVKRQNVAGIFTYTDWVTHQKWGNVNWKRYCLLKSYGFLGNIVSQMLHMVSNTGPYLILYSGHDHTVEQLSTTLGVQNHPLLLQYGSRVIFEVYHDNRELHNGARDAYFRVLINGKDVTKQITFCKNVINPQPKVTLCKIEDIVRFAHDDYFSSVNATNFKDACFPKSV